MSDEVVGLISNLNVQIIDISEFSSNFDIAVNASQCQFFYTDTKLKNVKRDEIINKIFEIRCVPLEQNSSAETIYSNMVLTEFSTSYDAGNKYVFTNCTFIQIK